MPARSIRPLVIEFHGSEAIPVRDVFVGDLTPPAVYPQRGGSRKLNMGPNLVEKGQTAYGFDERLLRVENNTNLRADLLQQAERWSAHEHVAQCAGPHDM